jgi:hypothetical protein
MNIGFCATAMDRRWQVERTLAPNLDQLRGTGSFLALCDFNSRDGLPALVRRHAADLQAGTLVYFRTEEPEHYHSSKAKNLAHRLALTRAPDVLFNLDADNFIGAGTIALVTRTFSAHPDSALHNWTTDDDGSCGRVALAARNWIGLGGYDEALLPAAWQDLDLLMRARAAGLRYVLEPGGVPLPVPNVIAEKVGRLEPTDDPGGPIARYQAMLKRNILISLGRPARLDLDAQHRYRGRLNFAEDRVI